ncbi:DUF2849 domain-containing protein [Roseicitreum antarcticum]|uniref:DUF2849 domain-containing protein n=1 Tax=Roseicitreum antarcticum TaxID=564137 RepID=A0A1H2QNP0_9RHOB|nr:DUF2849 domain-containing protein [Roseicitreum antarcticum]SDW08520.1 Protein of unknown function [Roseicitreum antarcticum]
MSRAFTPSVIAANHLLTGEVVYLNDAGRWTPEHSRARLFTDADVAQAELARDWAAEVVGAGLAAAQAGPDGPEPVHFRDVFRARGPSNRPHGKQAESCRA